MLNVMYTKTRDFRIDLLKFFAIFLIINSHSDIAYPKYSMLATGGAIGDCLFLFCSGFTLLLGGVKRFDLYYRRRINRIYPSVFASVVTMMTLGYYTLENLTIKEALGGEFVIAIMTYYVLLWLIQKYCRGRIPLVLLLVMIVTLIAYWFFPYKYETSSKGLYGTSTLFRWIPYFGAMLLGAYIGVIRERLKFNIRLDTLKLLGCLFLFYVIQFLAKEVRAVAPFQIVTMPFLFGIVYYAYKCCNAEIFHKIYVNRYGNWIVLVVGGLCLESYLIQFCVITDKLNGIFPLNLPVIFLAVLLLSYLVRCLARLFSQTFRTEDYEWRKIFAWK